MPAAGTLTLALCAALTLRALCQPNCDEHVLSIWVYKDEVNLANEDNNQSFIPYGNYIHVRCIGENGAALVMSKNGQKLQTKGVSYSEIEKYEMRPDLQVSRFVCADVTTACERSEVVTVTPALVVASANLRRFDNHYAVKYGHAMTVSCSGPVAAGLVLSQDGEILTTEQRNETTVVWSTNKPDLQISEYVCTDRNTTINSSVFVRVVPKIRIRSQSKNESETPVHGPATQDWEMMEYTGYTFGEVIELTCFGPRGVKLINLRDNQELSQYTTGTAVKSLIEIYRSTEFGCIDSKHPDSKSTVQVFVKPRIEVTSPSIQRGRYSHWYGIKTGGPLQITCSGPDAAQLAIFKTGHITDTKERTSVVSNTTIMRSVKKELIDAMYYNEYMCVVEGWSSWSSQVHIMALPEAIGFRCISHNVKYLNCSWTASGADTNFTLYHVENGHLTRVCARVRQSVATSISYSGDLKNWRWHSASRFCTWYHNDFRGYPDQVPSLSFLMQSCNDFGCFNQTYIIKHLSIVKPDRPKSIQVSSTSSSGASLNWAWTVQRSAGEDLISGFDAFIFKVEYEQLGAEPLEANSSLVTCWYSFRCEIQLTLLPCPAQSYTVRIYQRLIDTVGEEFWSDPRTVNVNTKAENTPNSDSKCNPKPKETVEVLTYFNRKLRYEVHLDIQKVNKEVGLLKRKLAMIRTYLGQHTDADG